VSALTLFAVAAPAGGGPPPPAPPAGAPQRGPPPPARALGGVGKLSFSPPPPCRGDRRHDRAAAADPPRRERPVPVGAARRPDHRGLLPRRRPELLAHPRTEARLRPRRPAVGLHGHADLVRHPHAPRSRRPVAA